MEAVEAAAGDADEAGKTGVDFCILQIRWSSVAFSTFAMSDRNDPPSLNSGTRPRISDGDEAFIIKPLIGLLPV